MPINRLGRTEMIRRLFSHKNNELLETVLTKEYDTLYSIDSLKLKDDETMATQEELQQLLEQIRPEVHEFFNASTNAQCFIAYRVHPEERSEYCNNLISLEQKSRVKIIGDIAHEYAHHLQANILINIFRHGSMNPLIEGLARNAERFVVDRYAERIDNPAYIQEALDLSIPELISVRNAINELNNDSCKHTEGHYMIGVSDHAIGNAYMRVKEEQHGKNYYKDLFNQLIHEWDFL